MTPSRIAILACLLRNREFMKVEDLVERIERDNLNSKGRCDRATIYRTLIKLERTGIVMSTYIGDGISRYRIKDGAACSEAQIICTVCKDVQTLSETQIPSIEKKIRAMGYQDLIRRLEYEGTCADCQEEQDALAWRKSSADHFWSHTEVFENENRDP